MTRLFADACCLIRCVSSLPLAAGLWLTIPGATARAQTPDNPPTGHVLCAPERGQCSFSGSATVVYGARDRWTAPRAFSGGVACNNATFGDPLPYVVKACYFKSTEPAPLRTLYVNAACPTAGNGSSDSCGTPNGALRTLGAAHALSLPGDLIRVRAGTYDERIVFSRGGSAGSLVRWQTHGNGPVVWVNTRASAAPPVFEGKR